REDRWPPGARPPCAFNRPPRTTTRRWPRPASCWPGRGRRGRRGRAWRCWKPGFTTWKGTFPGRWSCTAQRWRAARGGLGGGGRFGGVRGVWQLLLQEGRDTEARTLLGRLRPEALEAPGLGRLAAELSLRTGTGTEARQRALELARRPVRAGSKNPDDHLWLGQVAWAAGQLEEAEKAFRRARDLAQKAPHTRPA